MKRFTLVMLCAAILAGTGITNVASAHGYYRHGFHGPRVGVFLGNPFWGPPPLYYGPPPVVYVTPPQPLVYTQQPQQPAYSYYCRRPAGYYPQVPRCPGGWMQVVRTVPTP